MMMAQGDPTDITVFTRWCVLHRCSEIVLFPFNYFLINKSEICETALPRTEIRGWIKSAFRLLHLEFYVHVCTAHTVRN